MGAEGLWHILQYTIKKDQYAILSLTHALMNGLIKFSNREELMPMTRLQLLVLPR